MSDYESAAFESVEQLKERHMSELAELTQKIAAENSSKTHWSRTLLDMRHQEKIFFSVKDYEKAELFRLRADRL